MNIFFILFNLKIDIFRPVGILLVFSWWQKGHLSLRTHIRCICVYNTFQQVTSLFPVEGSGNTGGKLWCHSFFYTLKQEDKFAKAYLVKLLGQWSFIIMQSVTYLLVSVYPSQCLIWSYMRISMSIKQMAIEYLSCAKHSDRHWDAKVSKMHFWP